MSPIRVWLVYLGCVLAGGAALAPGIWWVVHFYAANSSIAHQPFHRYVNRCLLGLALLGIWPVSRILRLHGRKAVGFVLGPAPLRDAVLGGMMGLVSLGLAALVTVSSGARAVGELHEPRQIAIKLAGIVAVASLVGALEEFLFRGALFSSIRHRQGWRAAAFWSSCIYGLAHFFRRAPEPEVVTWTSGWTVLGQMLQGFGDLGTLFPEFINLFLVGWLLAMARERTGGLALSWGLHAGWIFWLQTYRYLTVPGETSGIWFWGSDRLVDGWLPLVVLSVTGLGLRRLVNRFEFKGETSQM